MFNFFRHRASKIRRRPLRRFLRPLGEFLEDRRVLSTETWSGGDNNDNLWTSNDNWAGVGGAGADDDLVFPAGAGRPATFNDFPTNTRFGSLTFNGSGYSVTGNQIFLGG